MSISLTSRRFWPESDRLAREYLLLGEPGAMACLVEASSRFTIRDIDPLLSDDNGLAAAEAMLSWPFDKVRRDPVVDHPAFHVKAGDDLRLRVREEDDDVRGRSAGGQKLQTVAGCGEGDFDIPGFRLSEDFFGGHRIVLTRFRAERSSPGRVCLLKEPTDGVADFGGSSDPRAP
jgi:hypothetical protein